MPRTRPRRYRERAESFRPGDDLDPGRRVDGRRLECREIENHPAVPLDLLKATTLGECDAFVVVLGHPRLDPMQVPLRKPGRRFDVERTPGRGGGARAEL